MNLLEKVSTERIQEAIAKMANPDFGKVIQFYQYKVMVEKNDLTPEHEYYGLSDLYKELARREDEKQKAVEYLRGTLVDTTKVFED